MNTVPTAASTALKMQLAANIARMMRLVVSTAQKVQLAASTAPKAEAVRQMTGSTGLMKNRSEAMLKTPNFKSKVH